jgi:hypothetical protein
MKITVEYNPLAGHVIKDGEAEEWIDEIIKTAFNIEDEKDLVITVASSLLVDFFRLRLAEGVLSTDQIEFTFMGEVIRHNSYATFEHWPKGYCDTGDHVLEGLLTCQSKIFKERKKAREKKKLNGV